MADGLTVHIHYEDITDFVAMLQEHPKEAAIEIRRTMQMSVDTLIQTITGHTPVNTGILRGSITSEIHGEPVAQFYGDVFTPVIYGEPVEMGRKPGRMPPVGAIEQWVIRKLGVEEGKESRNVAFLIARSIGKGGTSGALMFEKGMKQAEPIVNRLWDDIPERILKYLEGK